MAAGRIARHEYDLDGNRTKKSDGTTTWTYGFDRTDQLSSVNGGPSAVGYNGWGDLTTKPEDDGSTTTYAYDLAGKLTAIGRSGTADDASFTFDALGRFRTRVLAASTDTYSYLGTAETVLRINNSVSGAVDSIVTSAGDRLGVDAGSTMNWLLPDPHGSIAASLSASETQVTNAIRYDAWGDTLLTGAGGGTAVGAESFKYQGRLDLSPSGLGEPLYDMSARFYSPSLGSFTQLDSVMGSAQNPLSMNRFLYAQANPATLIDPTGHWSFDPFDWAAQTAENVGAFGQGVVEGAAGSVVSAAEGIATTAVAAGSCALDGSCRAAAVATVQRGAEAFVADPEGTMRGAAATVVEGAKGAIASTADRVGTAWRTGNFRDLGKLTGEIGVSFVPVGGVLAKAGIAAKMSRVGSRVAEATGIERAGSVARAGYRALDTIPADRRLIDPNIPLRGLESLRTTPGGRYLTDHALTRQLRPPGGRRPFGLSEVDHILDKATRVRYDPLRRTVRVSIRRRTPYVVVDAATGRRVVSAVFNRHD